MRKSVPDALFPKVRQDILAACLLHSDKWWYLSDLAKHLELSPSSLQRELASLTQAGLLESRRDGNRVYYKANLESPGALDLQSFFIKTSGVTDVLKSALNKHFKRAQLAFIYGSMARGEEVATSDVDVLIVGDLKLSAMVDEIKKAENTLGREVNPTIYSPQEFRRKIEDDDGFIKTVCEGEKIFLKGGPDELKKLGR